MQEKLLNEIDSEEITHDISEIIERIETIEKTLLTLKKAQTDQETRIKDCEDSIDYIGGE